MKKNILIFILVGIIAFIAFNWFKDYSSMVDKELAIGALTSKVETYKTKYNQEVSSKQAVILERDNFKHLSDSQRVIINNFKDPEPVIIVETEFVIDTIYEKMYLDPISQWYKFNHIDPWYTLSGKTKDDQIIFNPPIIPNEQLMVGGWKSNGWFKKKTYHFDVSNTNPYIQTTNMQTYVVKKQKSWHEKWYISGAIGIVGGLLITK